MAHVEFTYVPGNGKHLKVEVAGFLFERNKTITLGTSYRCENHKTCEARLHLIENQAILYKGHNHAPEPQRIVAREIIGKGKKMLLENRVVTGSQVMSRMESLAAEAGLDASYLGSTNNLKRRFCDIQFKAHGRKNLGKTLEELEIEPSLTKTIRNDHLDFLLYDNRAGENRMLIFASKDALSKLEWCDTWLVDGTFKSCPSMFAQLYTIHGLYCSKVSVPLVYAYLPGKSEQIYTELFQVIRRNVPGEPATIISDFEIAAINALRATFIASELNGCLFHLTQSIFRHVQQNAAVFARYKNIDADGRKVRNCIRSLGALAFINPPEVPNAFYQLRGEFPQGDPVREIFSYFDDTYLGNNWNVVRFPIKFWNVRERIKNAQPRTNNGKEGWHYRFNSQLTKVHPAMYTSIEMIRKEENHWFMECQKIRAGHGQYRRRKSVKVEERLKNILRVQEAQGYENDLEFLTAVQTCLHEFLTEA